MPDALREAQRLIESGDYDSARALLEPIHERRPREPHVLLHLARARSGSEGLESAELLFDEARQHVCPPHVADLFRGEALLRQDRLEQAEEVLRAVMRADRRNRLAANLLALCLFCQGRHAEAFALWGRHGWSHSHAFLIEITIAFEQFLLQAPGPREIEEDALPEVFRTGNKRPLSILGRQMRLKPLLNRAERLLTGQKTLEAYRLTTRALELAPHDPDAILLRAVALYEMEYYEEAGRLLLEIAGDESFPLPRYFLAYSLLRLGQIEVAEAMMAKMAPQGPFDYYLHYHMGLARLLRGDLRGAREAFGIAYGQYFIDSREYCFEHLVVKVKAAMERLA